jgi:hypothetical protein
MMTKRSGWYLACAIVLASAPAAADGKDSAIGWLMNEPVTLFDLGILRLRQDLEVAQRGLAETSDSSAATWSGAYYDWREKAIIAYVSRRARRGEPSFQQCRDLFGRLTRSLLHGTPEGLRQAHVYLEQLFLHGGPGNFGYPRTIGDELVETVRLEVTILPPPPMLVEDRSVRCSGSLATDPAQLTAGWGQSRIDGAARGEGL